MRSRTLSVLRSRASSARMVSRSAQWLNHATRSRTPPGQRLRSSALSRPTRSAARARAASVQPSNGTSGRIAARSASLACCGSMGLLRRLGNRRREIDWEALPLLDEREQPMIGHALKVKHAIEVITFMLHHAGVETLDLAVDGGTLRRESTIADAREARHRAA